MTLMVFLQRERADCDDPRLWAAISILEAFVVNKGKIM